MKLVISLLVVANVLLFGWFRGWMSPFGGDGRDPSRIERQVDPQQLRVVPAPRGAAPAGGGTSFAAGSAGPSGSGGQAGAGGAGSPGTASGVGGARGVASAGAGVSQTGSALVVALRASNCAELGPMPEGDAVRVQVALDAVDADLAVATQRSDETGSWWVYLPPAPGDPTRRIADLRERGVTDTYVMPDGAWKGAISLGVFRQEDLAVALQRSLAAKGVKPVRVAPRGAATGRVTLQVRPVGEPVVAELARLRASLPDLAARPCVARG